MYKSAPGISPSKKSPAHGTENTSPYQTEHVAAAHVINMLEQHLHDWRGDVVIGFNGLMLTLLEEDGVPFFREVLPGHVDDLGQVQHCDQGGGVGPGQLTS